MAVSLLFNPVQVSGCCIGSSVTKSTNVSTPILIKSRRPIVCKRRRSQLLVAESDHIVTERSESSTGESVPPPDDAYPNASQLEKSVADDSKLPASVEPTPKKVPLTARERLRAARVLSRYSEPKPAKSEMGRSVLDALRESEKGKKGLPEAPTNLFDDSKRGLPKQGLTFNFPGGFDLFLVAFSFVFISTVMFATTYIVWKVGAIHFNEY